MGQRGSVQGLACHLGLLPQNYVVITPELIAALAATVAAILSGVALWLGGAREKHKWLRDELVDTVVQFLDASFASPGNALLHKRRESRLTAQDHEEALGVHRSALTALTRLRVLASEDVVKCAEKLHLADNDAYKMVFVDADLPDQRDWDSHRAQRQQLLEAMLNAARHEFRVGKAKAPDPALFGRGIGPSHSGATQQP
jgi:hypothetical protein